MFPVTFAAMRRRILCLSAFLLCLLLPLVALAEGLQAREVRLTKDFTTDPAQELPELFIDDTEIAGEVKKLLEREAKLARIEASVAGDLSGRLAKVGAEDQKSLWECLTTGYGGEVAYLSDRAGALVGFVTEEAPAIMNLYWFGTRVATALDETAAKRHALENKYLDRLLGQKDNPDSQTPAKTLFDSADPKRILETLWKRADAVRRLRQETMDSFLLTRRAVDRSGLPTANIERANDLWMSDVAAVDRPERELEAARSRLRELLADRETKLALVRHAEKLLKECKDDEKERKAALEAKLQRLKAQLQQAEQAIEAQNQKIGQLNQAIEKEKLGYDSTKGGVRKEAWTKAKLDELGAAMSSGYAELALRRRIMKRITREAVHNYEVAEKLSSFRRMQFGGKQREAIAMGAAAYSGKELRGAYIDQGIISLFQRERRDEDAFLLELDYALRIVSAAKKFGTDYLKKRFDDLLVLAKEFDDPAQTDAEAYKRKMADLRRQLRFFVDEIETFKEVGGGAFSVFIENAKTLLVVTGIYEARLEVEKTHEKVRNKRKDTDEQIELLEGAKSLADGAVASHFGITYTTEPWTFEEFQKKPKTKALELFYKDKMFHDTLDGGLRRITSAGLTARLDRVVAEYLIAYEKACYTLRELTQTKNDYLGLDPESGQFSGKLFLSPVRTLVAAGRFGYRWLDPVYGPHETEIEQWVTKRSEQLEGMRLMFDQLKKANFNWPKIGAVSKRTKFSWHLELLWEHPEYRRFWHRLLQENYSDNQAGLIQARQTSEQWFSKQVAEEKLELLEESMPSPKFLAPAHLQDSLDLIQLYNYPAALQSLIQANTLDPDVVSTEQINRAEDMMAWWETGEKWGRLATEIADQCVWALLTQGVMKSVVGSLRTGLGSYLKVTPPPVPAVSLPQMFGNVLKGYVNPLRNVVSFDTLRQEGLLSFATRMVKETSYELAEDSFKEEVLLRQLRVDPAVADRLAGMMFTLATESLEATYDVGRTKVQDFETHQRIVSSPYYNHCAKLYRLVTGQPDPAGRPKAEADKWKERRPLERDNELKRIDQELAELTEDGTTTATKPGKKAGEMEEESLADRRKRLSSPEAERKRQWLNLRKRLLTQAHTPESVKAILEEAAAGLKNAEKMLEGKISEAERQKLVEECVELTRMFESSVKEIKSDLSEEKHKGTGGPEVLKEFLKKLDTARMVIHRESFNHATRILKNGTPEEIMDLLKRAEESRVQKYQVKHPGEYPPPPPLTDFKPPERMRQVMELMLVVFPTGSAGSLGRQEGGEYKPYESDMDYTVLLKEGKPPVTPKERVVLEHLLAQGLKDVGKGINVDNFDVAYMVDDASKFTGKALDRQSYQKVMEKVERIKKDPAIKDEAKRQEELDEVLKDFEEALDIVRADLDHPERYRTDGRLRMLWYLTALGDHMLALEDGQFVKKLKKDAGQLSDETIRELAQSKNAEVEDWMGWEIILDDLFFMGKKAPGVVSEMYPGGDKPDAGILKESGKRNIREMVGACCNDPVLKGKINKLLELAAKGEYADHKTFCEKVVEEMKNRGVETDPPMKDLLEHIELMGKYKNDPDIDKWIENAKAQKRNGPHRDEILAAAMRNHSIFASRMVKAACNGIEKHMEPIFTSRKTKAETVARLERAKNDLVAELARTPDGETKTRLKADLSKTETALKLAESDKKIVEMIIKKKLLTSMAGFHYQGGHLPEAMRTPGKLNSAQKALIQAMRAAGATETDIQDAFKEISFEKKKKVMKDGKEVEVSEKHKLNEEYGALVSGVFSGPPPRRIVVDPRVPRRRFPPDELETEEEKDEEGLDQGKDGNKDEGATGGGAALPPAPDAPKPDGTSYVPEWRFQPARFPVWRSQPLTRRSDRLRMAA